MTARVPKILVVDDNDVNRMICEEILRDDYDVSFAADGVSAIEAAAQLGPDLILLDVMMPGIDGLETCRLLRRSTRPWVKIIMVSAKVQANDRLAGYEAGADDFLGKPFEEDELLAKIRVHLRLKHVEEIDAVKYDLLQVLQHGNRTPMTPIMGNAEMLMSMYDSLSDEERRNCVATLSRNARRLHEWLQAGETLIGLKTAQTEFAPRPLSLADLVESAVEELAEHDPDVKSRIRFQTGSSNTVECDSQLGNLLVKRLLLNALATGTPGCDVNVNLEEADDNRIRLRVQHDADPISPECLPKYFEPFQACEEVLHNLGDGLSMAIAREIVLLHGGRIRAANLPQNGGVEVLAELPVAQPVTDRRSCHNSGSAHLQRSAGLPMSKHVHSSSEAP